MIWVNEAKKYLTDFCSEDARIRIENTAYKDKYVCLECEVVDNSGSRNIVFIVIKIGACNDPAHGMRDEVNF